MMDAEVMEAIYREANRLANKAAAIDGERPSYGVAKEACVLFD
jgi:hypothetical protein